MCTHDPNQLHVELKVNSITVVYIKGYSNVISSYNVKQVILETLFSANLLRCYKNETQQNKTRYTPVNLNTL